MKNKSSEPEVKKEELTKEELMILVQVLAQAQTNVQRAPRLIELVNKLSRIIDVIK